jgi:hypothetical protein
MLTDAEKQRARYHLGYPGMSTIPTAALGVLGTGQAAFLVERAFTHVLPVAEDKIREILCECDAIESQTKQARQRLSIAQSDTTRFRTREELRDLDDLYALWTDKLADILSVPKNPYSYAHGDDMTLKQ